MAHPDILHPAYFEQSFYPITTDDVENRLQPSPFERTVNGLTVLIRSCNDTPEQIERLHQDIAKQDYEGDVQVIGVDCGNNDPRTRIVLEEVSHSVVRLERDFDFMPASLAAGMERADYATVVTTVGHAALVTKRHLSRAAEMGAIDTIGGAYGMALPDIYSSLTERIGADALGAGEQYTQGVKRMTHEDDDLGLLAADCAVIKKSLFDHHYPTIESYGFGGADGELGKLIIGAYEGASEKDGALHVIRDPLLAVHHTHGFGPFKSLRQLLAWKRMANPRDYNEQAMRWHPNRGL
jgi:hypothetical protein